ncbi:hypothetical protein AZE42_00542 [Rhizopogon vesiculosus]|uniref:Uncharacterized protein n=1 Tax=Rhizopogon vesiculosus TaxID=180088 RepID=A0A1J8QUB4_9AGAM|nr:hypothetical protein AZE42_00542 [Rhizopogon vesiculosus]
MTPHSVRRTLTPSPWHLCVHPQGWVYFFHPVLRILTAEDIRDTRVHDLVMQKATQYATDEEDIEIKLFDISLKPTPMDHLVVNHAHCVASHEFAEVQSKNISNMEEQALYRARRHYWNHVNRHPVHFPTPEGALRDAVDALVWYFTDNLITGSNSTVPFSKAECEELLRLLKHTDLYSGSSPSKSVFLAWILKEVYSFRIAEDYGKYTEKQSKEIRAARTSRQVSVPEPQGIVMSSVLSAVVTIFFFGIPRTYLAHVKAAWKYRGRLDNVQQTWNAYIKRLVQEYSNFLLIATVLLSATVSFLTVSDIEQGGLFACIIATLCSLGSIIVGVFCIWSHQNNTTTAASFSYMHNVEHSLGLQVHAMLLSLPPVLLVWAILTFTASIVAYSLQALGNRGQNPATSWVVVGIFVLILLAVSTLLYSFSVIWKWQSPIRSRFRFRRS